MARVVLYARFSPRKNSAECESIETQVERMRAACVAHGHEIIGEPHVDRDLSGKSMHNRPGLQAAIEVACCHKAALMVRALDRLARSTRDSIDIAERLERCGSDLISLKENLDTTTALGRMFFTFIAMMAQFEREQTAERTSDAMIRHQGAGRAMSKQPPYGMKEGPGLEILDQHGNVKVRRTWANCPAEQSVITTILQRHAKGWTPTEIARRLNLDGVPCRGSKWRHALIQRICERHAKKALTGQR